MSFLISGQAYVIPAERVLEVGRRPVITRVPNAPAALAGLMNFRGAAVPAIRLSALIDATEVTASNEARIIVYDYQHPVALLIDEILPLTATGSATAGKLDIQKLLAEGFVTTAAPARPKIGMNATPTSAKPGEAAEERSLVAFTVSGQNFALPLDVVAEVTPLPAEVTGWPRSEAAIMGMFPLRGEVLPLISIARLLYLQDGRATRHHIVVTRLGPARVGLVVDELVGVRRIAEAMIEPVPGILQRGEGDAEIDAIARAGGTGALISILSPSRLFRNRVIREIAVHNQTGAGAAMHRPEAASHRFIIFSIGDDVFGLPLEAVSEIVQLPDAIAHVPNAPAFIAGVINLRGKPLPVIDQRLRFNAVNGQAGRKSRVIVLTIGQFQAGFIVDQVSEILAVPAAAITPAPPLPGDNAQTFDRVAARGADGAMILLINPEELLQKAERDLLDRFKPDAGAMSKP
ncbi:chemotaxis protein CheW [Bosea sp. 2YAB26]|uniref:chemotaxis protein CheW n=1 Tax=Bosea sp. 2YAB26 TaxID=3237478 RepID=UPI003F8DCE62